MITSRCAVSFMVLVLFLVGLLAGGDPAGAASEPKRGGVFRIAERETPNLDPHLNVSFLTHSYMSLVYNHLVRFPYGPEQKHASDFTILPDLAERWEISGDGKTYTFFLRKGVRFHNKSPVNGREVTAQDVKYSLERFRAKSGFRSRFDEVESIDVLDALTVRIRLKNPFAPFLNHLASPAFAVILPREAEEKFGNFNSVEAAIGTGPFILVSYQKGVKVRFERNPNYFVRGLPYLDAVEVEITPEAATRLALLRTGKVEIGHIWGWQNAEEVQSVRQAVPQIAATRYWPNNYGYIYVRTDQAPFTDVRVRRALSLAIERKAWIESLYQGEGCVDSGPIPCGWVDWKLDATKLDPARAKPHIGYDPPEAKRLLAQAGHPNGFSRPLSHYPGYILPWPSLYELATDNLSKIGIQAEMRPQEYGAYITTTFLGKFDGMAMGPITPFTEVDDFLYSQFYPDQPNNRSHVNDPELTRMLVAQRRAVNPKDRKRLVHEIQLYLLDKAYYTYVPIWPQYVTHAPSVRDFVYHDGYGLGQRLQFTWLDR